MPRVFAALYILSGMLLACTAQPTPTTERTGTALYNAYVSAWNAHDSTALDTLMTPDAVHEDIAQNFRGQGPAQIKEFMRGLISAEPDFVWNPTRVIESGPMVAAEWTWTATYTGASPIGPVTARRITGRGSSIAEVENGKIKRFTDYYDIASFFR